MFGAMVLTKWLEIEPMYTMINVKSFVESNACFPDIAQVFLMHLTTLLHHQ